MKNIAILAYASTLVIPAHAGIQSVSTCMATLLDGKIFLDSRMRENDGKNRARS